MLGCVVLFVVMCCVGWVRVRLRLRLRLRVRLRLRLRLCLRVVMSCCRVGVLYCVVLCCVVL